MKKLPSLLTILSLVVLIFLFILVFRIFSGALHLVSDAFNAVLGIVVILAMIFIVFWMLSYAKKKK